MNICFLLGGFQGNGGIGRVVSILANKLSENKFYKVHTISFCEENKPMLYNLSEDIIQHKLYTKNISMTKALLFKRAVGKVKKIIKENEIDILIACGALYYPLAILASRNNKCYCWEHTNPSISSDHKYQNACRKYAIKRADKFIVLTKSAEKYYLNKLNAEKDKLTQIYNPVDSVAFKSKYYNTDSKKIISVGRLCYQKNFELLIDVAEKVFLEHKEWTWDIYGEGGHRPQLEEILLSKNLVGRVNLKGQESDLYERYKDYSFMVMTSRYEGFPMSLIEGAANRLPLISFNIQTGPDEIIEDGHNGFLINEYSCDAMSAKVEQIISLIELRKVMAENVYETAKTFELNEIIKQWEQICKI